LKELFWRDRNTDCGAKRWRLHSFGFALYRVCALGAKTNVSNVRCHKKIVGGIFLKKLFSAVAFKAVSLVFLVLKNVHSKSVSLMVAVSRNGCSYVQGLANCGYSVIRQPGTVVDFYLKLKIKFFC
jgi:hypothetical protein